MKQKGFGLFELMAVLAIAALLVLIAYPYVMSWFHRMEARQVRSVLNTASQLARLESFATKQNVVFCLADVNNVCNRLAQEQILVFYDNDHDQTLEHGELIQSYPLKVKYGQLEMRASLLRNHMKYFGTTATPKGHFGHIKYCANDPALSYRVVVNQTGGAWVREGC